MEAVRACLKEGDNIGGIIDLPNQDHNTVVGVTPLYLAAQQGHLEICKLLLMYGADINQQCCIPMTGDVFGPCDIAMIHFHWRTWWFLSQRKQQLQVKFRNAAGPFRVNRGSLDHLAEPLLIS